ncbi:MAG: 4Fe-4S dicluster domain-containing protein [Paludibacter sp.]|nr:4Fe-4S dicluster domain-containing protein [Paludibacter sp.]
MKFLKNIRVAIAILFFLPILLFFIDFIGKLPLQLHELLKFQWIPALLSLNLVLIGILLVLSLLFGRIYCSTICPLGVFQDIISWKSRFFKKKKKKFRFKYMKSQNILRYTILGLTIVAFIFGSSLLVILFDPYSTFGRIISQLFRPLAIWGNNSMAALLSGMGNYSMYKVEQVGFVPVAFSITILFFIGIGIMSWFRGRLYCNTICPVGTTLGLFAPFSLFRISIKKSTCTRCGSCEKTCKSQCIDSETMKVDDSRCVSCFNCLTVCKKASMKYEFRYKKSEVAPIKVLTGKNSRRTFLLTSGAVITSIALAKANTITGKKDSILSRKPIMPPGAINIEHFNTNCTGCQLCVTKCPMQVLKPASLQYGISGIMQPHLAFSTHIFCTFDCNICSAVCPTKALTKMPMEEKKVTQIGIAKLRLDMCEVITHETDCGACSEHCPTQAVHMIPYKNGLTKPEVIPELCIGCGGCESICPVRPYQAIYVEGVTSQLKAKKPEEAKKFDKVIDDFGF